MDAKTGEGPELMLLGDVTLNQNRLIMKRPEMVIGTDRLELYEFMAHRREVLISTNRNWLKVAFAATFLHMLIV